MITAYIAHYYSNSCLHWGHIINLGRAWKTNSLEIYKKKWADNSLPLNHGIGIDSMKSIQTCTQIIIHR